MPTGEKIGTVRLNKASGRVRKAVMPKLGKGRPALKKINTFAERKVRG